MLAEKSSLQIVKRNILWHGTDYSFDRFKTNEFGETTTEVSETNIVRGIFHTASSGYVFETTADSGIVESKQSPQISCLHESIIFIEPGDQVIVSGHKYKVTGTNDVNEMKILGEISLEMVL